MAENNNQQPQGLQIELKPEIGVGVYANLALITHSSSDFILDSHVCFLVCSSRRYAAALSWLLSTLSVSSWL